MTHPEAHRSHSTGWLRGFLLVLVLLPACSPPAKVEPNDVSTWRAAFMVADMTTAVQQKWARSCALCHVNGEGGAPRVGDVAAWLPRLENGEAVLMQHTLVGLNRMPPLGYCMDCELTDFAAMINFMSGKE